MRDFSELIKDPRFGKRYSTDPVFKRLTDTAIKELYPMFKMDVLGNDVRFIYEPLGKERLTLDEAIEAFSFNRTTRSTREYTGTFDTHFTGIGTNEQLNRLAQQGYTVQNQMRDFATREDLENFISSIRGEDGKLKGFPIPRGDRGVAYINVLDKQGRQLANSEILELLGFKEGEKLSDSIFKRMSVFVSDREMSLTGDRTRMFLFDPKKLALAENPSYEPAVRSILKNQQALGIGDLTEDEIYQKMFDGENFITRDYAKKVIEDIRERGREFKAEAEKARGLGPGGTRRYEELMAMANKHFEVAHEQEANMLNNGRFNLRVVKGIDQNGNLVEQVKGDVGVITKAQEEKIKLATGLETLEDYDIFTSRYDVKDEMSANPYLSAEFHGRPREINTNVLSLGAHQSLMDPEGQIAKGARITAFEDLEMLRRGQISENFKAMLREMANLEVNFSDPISVQAETMRAKRFAVTIQRQIAAGININSNEYTLAQFQHALLKHYSVLDNKKKFKKDTLNIRGREIPNYELSLPVRGSFGGHVTGMSLSSNDAVPVGTLRPAGNAIQVNRLSFGVLNYAAAGGSDYDDRLQLALQYDPKSRRLMFLTTRSPDEAAEFAYYNADISLDPRFSEIRMKDSRFKLLNSQIASSRGNAESIRRLIAERDQLAEELHQFFMQTDMVQRLEIGSLIEGVEGRPHMVATPKGYKRSSRSLSRYRNSALYSYKTSTEVASSINALGDTESIFANQMYLESKSLDYSSGGSLPFKYVSTQYNEWFDTYFRKLDLPKQADPTGSLEERTIGRIVSEFETKGILGRSSNINAFIDQYIRSNLEHLPTDLANSFFNEWMKNKPERIEKEMAVDLAKKLGIAGAFEKIDNSLNETARLFGSFVAKMTKITNEYNARTGSQIASGIDPVMASTRLGGFTNLFLEGYRSEADIKSIEDAFLPMTDPKAFIASKLQEKIDLVKDIETQIKIDADAAREIRLEKLEAIKFTPEEMNRASDFISYMNEYQRGLSKLTQEASKDPFEMLKGLDFLLDQDLAIDDLNTAALRKLHEYGLFDEIEQNGLKYLRATPDTMRQVLAISKVLGENKASLGMLMSVGMPGQGGRTLGMEEIFTAARQKFVEEPEVLAQIDQLPVNEIIGSVDVNKFFDPNEGNVAIINRILREDPKLVDNDTTLEVVRMLNSMNAEIVGKGKSRRVIFRTNQPQRVLSGTELPGGKRFSMRSQSDEAANVVSEMGRESMRLLDRDFIKEIWNKPVGRNTIIGLGAFIGFGLLHRAVKDPTPEDMGGPPLLPGGNPYEDYDTAAYSDISSIYPSYAGVSSEGMRYTINTSSGYDPHRLGTDLSTLTGASSYRVNVYNSRSINRRSKSSKDILNEIGY